MNDLRSVIFTTRLRRVEALSAALRVGQMVFVSGRARWIPQSMRRLPAAFPSRWIVDGQEKMLVAALAHQVRIRSSMVTPADATRLGMQVTIPW